ncbi:MAG: hypothetical protein AAB692_05165 [Patescibacteria group bacterium]|mgnify:CR=1 FL=1
MKKCLCVLVCLAGCGQELPWQQTQDASQPTQSRGDDFPSPTVDTPQARSQQVAPNTRHIAAATLLLSDEKEPLSVTGLAFLVTTADSFFLRAGDVALGDDFVISNGATEVLKLRGDDPWLYGAPNRCFIENGIVTGGCYFDDVDQMIHGLRTPIDLAPGAPVTLTFTFGTDWRARNDRGYKVFFLAVVSRRPADFTQSVTTLLIGFEGDRITIRDPTTFCDPIVAGLYGFSGCCGTHSPLEANGQIPAYSLVQRGDSHGVSVLGYDGKLRSLRSSFELTSWFALNGPEGFPDVTDHLVCNRVITLPDDRFDAFPSAPSLTLHPGLHVVMSPTNQLYVVARGRILRPVTQLAATYLYPDSLGDRLLPLPQDAINEYVIGAEAHGPGDYDAILEYQYAFIENESH